MRELLVLTVALLTVGCTATGSAPPPPTAPEPPVAALPLPTPRPEGPPKPLRTPMPRPEHPEAEPFRLERLGGASEAAVIGMIGPPDEVRDQPPGKVWVYNHGPCRVEVYLYPSVDVGSMAVLGSALAPNTLANDDRDRCRRSLARRTAKAP